MFRALEHHVLISTPTGFYLEGHPEVTIDRYQGGRGNRNFRAWEIRFKGRRPGDHDVRETTLENVNEALMRFGDCEDCGEFCYRQGHPPKRCAVCNRMHDEMVRGYYRAAAAVRAVDKAWDLAEAVRAAPSVEAAAALLVQS